MTSPSSATDISVANGTPSWPAIATEDMFPEIATPEYINANCSPPLQVAATSSQRISPRRNRSHGHTTSPTIRKRRKVRNTGGKRSALSLTATMLRPQIVDGDELPEVRPVNLGHSGMTSSGAGARRL